MTGELLMDYYPILLLLSGLLPLAVLSVMSFLIRGQRRRLTEARSLIDALKTDLNGLCAGAVGVDRHITTIDKQVREFQHRLDAMEAGQKSQHPYGEAIQMVHKGATARRLVDELGLSHSEADLVVMLHSMKKAG